MKIDGQLWIDDNSKKTMVIKVMTCDGHPTYLPVENGRWIVNDTYPDELRYQRLFLFETERGVRRPIGAFKSPNAYVGEWRCDLHPAASVHHLQVALERAWEKRDRWKEMGEAARASCFAKRDPDPAGTLLGLLQDAAG